MNSYPLWERCMWLSADRFGCERRKGHMMPHCVYVEAAHGLDAEDARDAAEKAGPAAVSSDRAVTAVRMARLLEPDEP